MGKALWEVVKGISHLSRLYLVVIALVPASTIAAWLAWANGLPALPLLVALALSWIVFAIVGVWLWRRGSTKEASKALDAAEAAKPPAGPRGRVGIHAPGGNVRLQGRSSIQNQDVAIDAERGKVALDDDAEIK